MLIGADHQGQQACGAAKLAFVKHKLRWPPLQGQHGAGQLHAGGPGVHRGNGGVGQLAGRGGPGRGPGLRQTGRFVAGGGQQHVGKGLAIDLPARARAAAGECVHPCAQVQLGPLVGQPVGGGLGEQGPHVHAGDEKVGAAPPGKQAVGQDAQKHAATGCFYRQVQGRDAQRGDKTIEQTRRQALAQVGHGGLGGAFKACPVPAGGAAQQGEFFGPSPALGAGDAQQRIPGWGQIGQVQALIVAIAQIQGAAQQGVGRVDAHVPHERQAVAVSADEDVLAVVHPPHCALRPGNVQPPGATAPVAAAFKHADGVATGLRQRDGSGHAGPAAADDGGARCVLGGAHMRPRACIFQASHSLRRGVRPMRWCSTW